MIKYSFFPSTQTPHRAHTDFMQSRSSDQQRDENKKALCVYVCEGERERDRERESENHESNPNGSNHQKCEQTAVTARLSWRALKWSSFSLWVQVEEKEMPASVEKVWFLHNFEILAKRDTTCLDSLDPIKNKADLSAESTVFHRPWASRGWFVSKYLISHANAKASASLCNLLVLIHRSRL